MSTEWPTSLRVDQKIIDDFFDSAFDIERMFDSEETEAEYIRVINEGLRRLGREGRLRELYQRSEELIRNNP